jgi:Icc-related predicted phosphoesterase
VAEAAQRHTAERYKADAVLYAGDLTGKAMVPIVATGDRHEATLLGQRRWPGPRNELARWSATSPASATTPSGRRRRGGRPRRRPGQARRAVQQEIRARVRQWLDLAAERLDGTGVPLVLIPGNDDPYDIDEPLAASHYCTNADGTIVDIPGDLQVIGLGKSSPTPWQTPREVSEDAFREEIYSLATRLKIPNERSFLSTARPTGPAWTPRRSSTRT